MSKKKVVSKQEDINRGFKQVGKILDALNIAYVVMAETPLGLETLCNTENDLEFIYFCFLANGGRYTVEERGNAMKEAVDNFKKIKNKRVS